MGSHGEKGMLTFFSSHPFSMHIGSQFRKASKDARQSDTNGLKHKLQYLPSDSTTPIVPALTNGESKSDRGLNHPMIRDALVSWRLRRQINQTTTPSVGEEAEPTPEATECVPIWIYAHGYMLCPCIDEWV